MIKRFLFWHLCLTVVLAPWPFLFRGYFVPQQKLHEPETVVFTESSPPENLASSPEPIQRRIIVYKDHKGVFHLILVTFTPQEPSTEPSLLAGEESQRLEEDLEAIILQQAHLHGLDPNLIKAIIMVESHFDSQAVSARGAQGLMQLMPATAGTLHIGDPFHPEENIAGGVKYFRALLDQFQGDLTLALAAYNAGPAMVEKWQGVPPFPETEAYIRKVKAWYRLFANGSS